MFVRTKVIRRGEKQYRYLQLVENHRENGRVRQKVVLNLGRVESFDPTEVDQLVGALRDYTQHAQVLRSIEALHLHHARNWGDIWVLTRLWEEVGFAQLLSDILARRRFEVDIERALRAIVFNRCLCACSKLAAHRWVQQEVYFPESQEIRCTTSIVRLTSSTRSKPDGKRHYTTGKSTYSVST